MNPIFLSIEGLNSFYEKQDIDFVKLTRRKLFGIFGPTGSGKSTVLDGITLALYDQIARYDGRKGKEFIHMASEKCGVEFTFSLVEGGEEYTVFRSYKRYKDSYKTLQARFVKGGQVVAEGTMETNKAVLQVIGLGYEDFTRSVLLPQGKFSEFLLLTGAERSQMLERIFRLERYGSKFSGRLKGALSEQRLEENTVRTQILELGDIRPEQLVQLKTQWEKGTREEIKLKEAVFQAREKLQYSIQQFALVQEKLSVAEKIKEWTRKKAAFDKKKTDLAYQKKAVEFIPLWEQFQQTKKYFDENRQKERKLTADLKTLTKEYEEIKAKNEGVISKKQERYPVLLQQQQKIEQAVKIETEVKENESEREKLLQSYQQKQQFLNEKRNLLETLTQKRQAVDEKINDLQEQSQALFVSFEHQQTASEKANLQKALQEQEIKGEELEKKLSAEQYEIKNAQLKIQQHQGQIQVQEEKLLSIQKQLESLGQEIDLLEEKLALFSPGWMKKRKQGT